jgi:hypothetical protein
MKAIPTTTTRSSTCSVPRSMFDVLPHRPSILLLLLLFLPSATSTWADVHYVDAASANPTPPHTTWATAARVIQDAVDVAAPGEEIIVTNGVYATGGRAVYGTMTNRVTVDKPLTLRSVNGPQFTVIQGAKAPGGGNGDGAIRCVYLTNGASLSGFTLTNGATPMDGVWERQRSGGGLGCGSFTAAVSNCVLTGNSADGGGGAHGGTLDNCTLTGNSAGVGGGAEDSTLCDCTLSGNSAGQGGGASGGTLNKCTLSGNAALGGFDLGVGGGAVSSTLNKCTLAGNLAFDWGGGAYQCTLSNCTLTANSAYGRDMDSGMGGGAEESTLNNCTLTGNSAESGGGAAYSTLNNCSLTGNSADWLGGGAAACTLHNCTLAGNSAYWGGGASDIPWGGIGELYNCILYYNTDGGNYGGWCTLNYCCTTPLPAGVGNITDAPLFVDYAAGNLRLQSKSPCINAGNNSSLTYYNYNAGVLFTNRFDFDGNPRIISGTVDIGAYEYQGPGSIISYPWLQGYGLPTDGSADFLDPDRDGHTTWQEWRCQTDPTNALSALRLLSATPSPTNAAVTVTWQSVAGVTYFLERSTNLASPLAPLASSLPGQPGTTSYTDTNAAPLAPLFYRVGVP